MIEEDIWQQSGVFSLCGEGDAVRCTWLISSDCGFDSYSPYLRNIAL